MLSKNKQKQVTMNKPVVFAVHYVRPGMNKCASLSVEANDIMEAVWLAGERLAKAEGENQFWIYDVSAQEFSWSELDDE